MKITPEILRFSDVLSLLDQKKNRIFLKIDEFNLKSWKLTLRENVDCFHKTNDKCIKF